MHCCPIFVVLPCLQEVVYVMPFPSAQLCTSRFLRLMTHLFSENVQVRSLSVALCEADIVVMM